MKEALKVIISLPIISLLLMPGYYAGAKLVRAKKLSFGAAFLLVIFVGVALQICMFFLPTISSTEYPWLDFALSLCIYAVIAGFVFSYLVRNESDKSIGIGRGMALSAVFCTVGALILPVLSMFAVGIMSVFP